MMDHHHSSCSKCRKPLDSDTHQQGLQCRSCGRMRHWICDGLSKKDYKLLRDLEFYPYQCSPCRDRTPQVVLRESTIGDSRRLQILKESMERMFNDMISRVTQSISELKLEISQIKPDHKMNHQLKMTPRESPYTYLPESEGSTGGHKRLQKTTEVESRSSGGAPKPPPRPATLLKVSQLSNCSAQDTYYNIGNLREDDKRWSSGHIILRESQKDRVSGRTSGQAAAVSQTSKPRVTKSRRRLEVNGYDLVPPGPPVSVREGSGGDDHQYEVPQSIVTVDSTSGCQETSAPKLEPKIKTKLPATEPSVVLQPPAPVMRTCSPDVDCPPSVRREEEIYFV